MKLNNQRFQNLVIDRNSGTQANSGYGQQNRQYTYKLQNTNNDINRLTTSTNQHHTKISKTPSNTSTDSANSVNSVNSTNSCDLSASKSNNTMQDSQQSTRNSSPSNQSSVLTNSVTSDPEIELPNIYLSSNASSETRLLKDSKKLKKPIKMLQRLKVKVTKFNFPTVQAKLIYLPHEIEFEFDIGKDNTEFMAEGLTMTIQERFVNEDEDFKVEKFLMDVQKLLGRTIYELCVIEVQQLLDRQRAAREALETKFKQEIEEILKKSSVEKNTVEKIINDRRFERVPRNEEFIQKNLHNSQVQQNNPNKPSQNNIYTNPPPPPPTIRQSHSFNRPIRATSIQRPVNLNFNRQLSNGIFSTSPVSLTSPILTSPITQMGGGVFPNFGYNQQPECTPIPPTPNVAAVQHQAFFESHQHHHNHLRRIKSLTKQHPNYHLNTNNNFSSYRRHSGESDHSLVTGSQSSIGYFQPVNTHEQQQPSQSLSNFQQSRTLL